MPGHEVVIRRVLGWFAAGGTLARGAAVRLKRQGGPADPPPAVFPHWIHRIRYTCYACHPGPIGPSSKPITHEDECRAGLRSRHDGRTAWGIGFATCTRCHVTR